MTGIDEDMDTEDTIRMSYDIRQILPLNFHILQLHPIFLAFAEMLT
jgi:hypothetical protein